MSKYCTREILVVTNSNCKFSISLEKLKIKMKECYNLSCILSQDDVMEFAEDCLKNKGCICFESFKSIGDYMTFFTNLDEEN